MSAESVPSGSPSVSHSAPLHYDPLRPADWQDPYPLYRRLRDESPVYYSPGSKTYTISRYDDVVSALRRPELFSSSSAFDLLFEQVMQDIGWRDVIAFVRFMFRTRANPARLREGPKESMIMLDPPRHDELRAIVNRGFTPRRIEAWETRIGEIVAGCMKRLENDEPFDVIRDLAIPVPMEVIAEIIGIDPARRDQFKKWSDEAIAGVSSANPSKARPAFLSAITELTRYLGSIVEARRAEPRDDLISLLVDPSHGETLDEGAVMQFVLLLLVAGNETTTNLIGNAVIALLRNPDQLERVVADPGLVPSLVEEAIRYDGPVQFILRRTTEDVEVAGTSIPAQSRVAVLLGAANRDERRFADPDRFDIGRDAKGHVGFGFGLHFCLGASLARLEAQAALGALIPELPNLRARCDEHAMVESVLVRGRKQIELVRTSSPAPST
jgi:cytochrome P450